MLQYSEDFDEHVPTGNVNSSTWGDGWAGHLNSYIKSNGVYRCPDSQDAPKGGGGGSNPALAENYAMNANLTTVLSNGHGTGSGGYLPLFTAPSVTVCLCESEGTYAAMYNTSEVGTNDRYISPTTTGANLFGMDLNESGCNGLPCWLETGAFQNVTNWSTQTVMQNGSSPNGFPVLGWHNGGCNYLMLDGHAKWLMGTMVSAGTAASSPNSAQTVANSPVAAGTANLGSQAVTFSPI